MPDTSQPDRSTTRPVILLVDTTVLTWLALAVGGLGIAHLGVLAAVYGLGIEDGWGSSPCSIWTANRTSRPCFQGSRWRWRHSSY